MTIKQFKSKDMEKVFEQISNTILKSDGSNSSLVRVLSAFRNRIIDANPEDIKWNEVCTIASNDSIRMYFLLIVYMLQRKIYTGEHSSTLYRLLPSFNTLIDKGKIKLKNIMRCDDVEYLVIIPLSEDSNTYFYVNIANENLRRIYMDYLVYKAKSVNKVTFDFIYHFESSLGQPLLIKSVYDFNDVSFWKQVDYFKNLYSKNKEMKAVSLTSLIFFYRYLVNVHPEHDYFKNSINFTNNLLFSSFLTYFLNNNYHFMTFSPHKKIEDKIRYIVILKGFDKYSTGIKKEDYVSFDMSEVSTPLYRVEIMNYLINSGVVSYLASSSVWVYIKKAMIFFEKLKKQSDYPNPSLTHFTTQEAIFLSNYLNDNSVQLASRNNRIGAAKRFLSWCAETKSFTFENMFFDYLSQYEEPSKTTGSAVPEKDLILLNDLIKEKAKHDHFAKLCYSIFHLCIQTEFRVNQICHLTVDCIKPTVKPNQFVINSITKTSIGRKDSFIITDLTYRHLMEIINETESFRENIAINSLKKYIFLYQGRTKETKLLTGTKFSHFLSKCCQELKLSNNYNASNLRDTHMTKSFEYVLRNNKSDAVMTMLSKHKFLDTTKNHYIEMELEKMLESTYGIIIGNSNLINPEKNIVDKIPAELSKKSNIVENGCGNCKVKSCVKSSPLPCLACEHFVTTVAHEKYFIKAIKTVDSSIKNASTPHDIDDLNTIKSLYVQYLKAIYLHKELNHHDRS